MDQLRKETFHQSFPGEGNEGFSKILFFHVEKVVFLILRKYQLYSSYQILSITFLDLTKSPISFSAT